MASESSSYGATSISRYLIVYVCILILSGIQIVLAYQHTQGAQLLARMLTVAVLQAVLAILFFMHMLEERRTLSFSLAGATLFVLLMMNMIWTDSFRLFHMHPFAQ